MGERDVDRLVSLVLTTGGRRGRVGRGDADRVDAHGSARAEPNIPVGAGGIVIEGN
ncbi:hypothetical protein [Haloarchaeobius sp. DYHT-AS-18]|uniref:hypothetical protein n=1 Tax=Haloarchaeobius sp. DYHT-AS-18 TaxID=3446117 RepID=UPI003EBA1410